MGSSGLRFSTEKEQKMTRRKRRNHTSAFKAKVALAALKGERYRLKDKRKAGMTAPGKKGRAG